MIVEHKRYTVKCGKVVGPLRYNRSAGTFSDYDREIEWMPNGAAWIGGNRVRDLDIEQEPKREVAKKSDGTEAFVLLLMIAVGVVIAILECIMIGYAANIWFEGGRLEPALWGYFWLGLLYANFQIPLLMMAVWFLPAYTPYLFVLTWMVEKEVASNAPDDA